MIVLSLMAAVLLAAATATRRLPGGQLRGTAAD